MADWFLFGNMESSQGLQKQMTVILSNLFIKIAIAKYAIKFKNILYYFLWFLLLFCACQSQGELSVSTWEMCNGHKTGCFSKLYSLSLTEQLNLKPYITDCIPILHYSILILKYLKEKKDKISYNSNHSNNDTDDDMRIM